MSCRRRRVQCFLAFNEPTTNVTSLPVGTSSESNDSVVLSEDGPEDTARTRRARTRSVSRVEAKESERQKTATNMGETVPRPERRPASPSARTPPWILESKRGWREENEGRQHLNEREERRRTHSFNLYTRSFTRSSDIADSLHRERDVNGEHGEDGWTVDGKLEGGSPKESDGRRRGETTSVDVSGRSSDDHSDDKTNNLYKRERER